MSICSANLKIEDLTAYLATKAKFANEKCMKRANFKVAIDQIEAALNGDDSGPLDVPPAKSSVDAAKDAAADDDEAAGDEVVEDEPFTESMINVSMSTTLNETATATTDADDSIVVVQKKSVSKAITKTPTSTPSAGSSRQSHAAAAAAASSATPSDSEPEQTTSRSGRKIKPKRYLHEEMEEAIVSSPAKRKASELSTVVPVSNTPTTTTIATGAATSDTVAAVASPEISAPPPSKILRVKHITSNDRIAALVSLSIRF